MNPKRNSSAVKSASTPRETIAETIAKSLTGGSLTGQSLCVLVKSRARETEILGWDASRNALRVAVAAKPEHNEANKELIRFFTNTLKKPVVLVSGAASKMKLLKFV